MRKIALLFAATLSMPLASGYAAQDSVQPAEPPLPALTDPTEPGVAPAVAPDRAELRKRLEMLKAQRTAAASHLAETRKAFQSSKVELTIKASRLRSARAENDKVKAETLEKEIVPLREEVRVRQESLRDALDEVKRLRTETRDAAEALGRVDAGKG
jgi:hypothetical protein